MTRPSPAWRDAFSARVRSGAYILAEDGRGRAGTVPTDRMRLPSAETMLDAIERAHTVVGGHAHGAVVDRVVGAVAGRAAYAASRE